MRRSGSRSLNTAKRLTSNSSRIQQLGTRPCPDCFVAAPALQLRDASRAKAFRELIGDRTVAELAKSDLEALTAMGRAAGVEPEDIEHLSSLAQLVTKVAVT
jgi:hypothetical protein